MIKPKYFVYAVIITTIILFVLGTWVRPAQANAVQIETPIPTSTPIVNISGVAPSAEEQEELQNIVQLYVELRYRALSVLDSGDFQQNGFGNLISDMHNAGVFLSEEMGKLAVEIKRADLNHLRYIDYKYFLDFSNFTMDASTQLVTVSVVEDNETI